MNLRAVDDHVGTRGPKTSALVLLLAIFICPWSPVLFGEVIPVKHSEGLVRGFLVLTSLEGKTLAHGDLIQLAKGSRVTLHLRFDFNDGSVNDETTLYSQRGSFRVLRYHLIQKGPSFPHPIEVTADLTIGHVTIHATDDKGKAITESTHLDLPPDTANGLVLTLLKNVVPDPPPGTLSYIAATPKPRLVKLSISVQGEDSFSVAGFTRKAVHYAVKPELGGVAGLIAPLLGKQPSETNVWILGGDAPAFVKSEGPIYFGGPIWRIELASPVWPKTPAAIQKSAEH